MIPVDPSLRMKARRVRRKQTDAERKLWSRLRVRQVCGAKFRRQHPVGLFIADFCSIESRLIIELDGSQHRDKAVEDGRRTAFLEKPGYRVVRFWDNDVLTNMEAVLDESISFYVTLTHAFSLRAGRGSRMGTSRVPFGRKEAHEASSSGLRASFLLQFV